MTTPRIEEMVNGYTKEAMLFKVGEGEMERHQRLQNYVVEALTQAHQAGIDEANSGQKSVEASWMALKDDYSEICRALGFEGDAWFGDPLVKHEDIVARAKALQDNK